MNFKGTCTELLHQELNNVKPIDYKYCIRVANFEINNSSYNDEQLARRMVIAHNDALAVLPSVDNSNNFDNPELQPEDEETPLP